MTKRTVTFNCEDSLHMKAIAVLIQKASAFRSSIWLTRGDRRANAKSLLGVMSLGIENGMQVEITAEGPDEEKALDEVAGYLTSPQF
ncbi:HPr family phosphocarrier protein [Oscillospiraceae bacterium HV4-5-C5C]|nr:HPr family phosphocarrier protein [Oscillospiraceae bacterium HV4-5-C5C]